MSHVTDKRFKSFLWSQTRKAAFAETRLSVDEDAVKAPVGKPQVVPAGEQQQAETPAVGRAKGRLTPLEQATMRMSEFCAPPAGAGVPAAAPGVMPEAEDAVTHQADWHLLHVHAQGSRESQGTATHLGRLNVRKAV
jgi:hypothetical protein